MATLELTQHRFHGDWNYTIRPRGTTADVFSYFLTGPDWSVLGVRSGRARFSEHCVELGHCCA